MKSYCQWGERMLAWGRLRKVNLGGKHREWSREFYDVPVEGIFLGVRIIYSINHAGKRFDRQKVALVSMSDSRNPVYIPFDMIERYLKNESRND